MKATVRFKDGTRENLTIVDREDDGSGEYGYARWMGWYVPVSQSTTYKDASGNVTRKDWDEVVGSEWIDEDERKSRKGR